MQVKSDNEVYGLTFTFIELLPCELMCRICKLPCKNPQISLCCKNNFCEGHLKTVSDVSTQRQCPMCDSEKFEAFPDAQADERMQALMMYCPNKDAGCKWIGKLSQVDEHCNSDHLGCIFQEVKCPNKCGVSIQRKDLENHLAADCPCYCQYCKTTGDKTLIANHHKEKCQKFTVQCPNDCGAFMLREEMNEHRKVCPSEEIQCEYYDAGCKILMLRKNREKHNKNCALQHLDLIKKKFSNNSATRFYGISFFLFFFTLVYVIIQCSQITAEYNGLKTYFAHLKVENEKLQKDIHINKQHVDNTIRDLKDEIGYIDSDIDYVKQENSNLRKYLNTLQDKYIELELSCIINTTMITELLKQVENNTLNAKIVEYFDITNNAYQNLSNIVKKDLHIYEQAIERNEVEFKKVMEEHYGTIMSTNWRLYLTMVHLVALHGDKVMPVVLAMHDYTWYVTTKEKWASTHFFDTDNGSYMDLLVTPIAFNVSVKLRLLSRVHDMQEGDFIIEMMNQYNDTDHSVGKIPYSEDPATTSLKVMGTEREPIVIGNVRYSILTGQEKVIYLKNDVIYFRVSFVTST